MKKCTILGPFHFSIDFFSFISTNTKPEIRIYCDKNPLVVKYVCTDAVNISH